MQRGEDLLQQFGADGGRLDLLHLAVAVAALSKAISLCRHRGVLDLLVLALLLGLLRFLSGRPSFLGDEVLIVLNLVIVGAIVHAQGRHVRFLDILKALQLQLLDELSGAVLLLFVR